MDVLTELQKYLSLRTIESSAVRLRRKAEQRAAKKGKAAEAEDEDSSDGGDHMEVDGPAHSKHSAFS